MNVFSPESYRWNGTSLGDAHALPGKFYIDSDIYKSEVDHILRKSWLFVGRADEILKSGDYRAIDTVGGPVILIRDETGQVRAFANFCRHRGAELLEGCGNRRAILCPYHAWSYKLNGALLGAPSMDDTPGFLAEENSLVSIPMEIWEGNIFLNFDKESISLADQLGNLPDLVASHKVADMVCTWRQDLIANCNWKMVLENSMETYHTGIVHAKTIGSQKSLTLASKGDWHAIQVLSETSIASLNKNGPAPFPTIEGLSEMASKGTFFVLLQPTTQFVFAQDCSWWLTVRPMGVDKTLVSVGGCFPKETVELPNFEERAKPYYERWEAVIKEDVWILEKQQRGFSSVFYTPGQLSSRDDVVHDMNRWVLDRLPLTKA